MKTIRWSIKYREFVSVMRNEFRYIFNDAGVILVVIGAIFIYSTVYGLAYKNEVMRNIPIAVVDNDRTPMSRQLIRTFDATPNVYVSYNATSLDDAKQLFFARKVYGVVVVPQGYEKNILGGASTNVVVYSDASYFLMYRQVFYDVVASIGVTSAKIEWQRLVAKGANAQQAKTITQPVTFTAKSLFNPYTGYGTFLMPAIIMVIIQQTLLIGIGMVGGTWREQKLYNKLIPTGERRLAVLPIILGKALAYLAIYCATLSVILVVSYSLFGYPTNGIPWQIVLFLIPYLLSCIFLGLALSTLFRYRENSLLLLLFTSIPFLLLSGASLPVESMPHWLYTAAKIFPSSSGVDGFVRLQTMGATLSDIHVTYRILWILTIAYFGLAVLGFRRVLRKVETEAQREGTIE